MRKFVLSATAALTLSACANPGAAYRSDTYTTSQVNQAQQATVVRLLAVSPAHIAANNTQNQQTARALGTIAGLALGAGLGGGIGHNLGAVAIGGAGGALAGNLAGSAVPATAYVDGVTLAYTTPDGHTLSSTQVGKTCEYAAGTDALMISTGPGETRIQPNATCPVQASR